MKTLRLTFNNKIILAVALDDEIFELKTALMTVRAVIFAEIELTFHIPKLIEDGVIEIGAHRVTLE